MSDVDVSAFPGIFSVPDPGSNAEADHASYAANRQLSPSHKEALKRCYSAYFPQLVHGLRQLHDNVDAEDIAQRAFETLARKLHETDIRNPEAFVWRVAKNLALRELRARGIRARLNDQVMAPDIAVETDPRTPELALVAREELERVYDILATMDARRREIFMLRRIDGLSHKEIAAKFGISRPAVSRHLSKAVAAIGASLSED